MTGLATILLLLIPFIPGLRDIPRLIPVHRLIWRSWYHTDPAPADSPDTPRPSDKTPASRSQRPVLLAAPVAPVTSQADASAPVLDELAAEPGLPPGCSTWRAPQPPKGHASSRPALIAYAEAGYRGRFG
jgi:hypothetical protein